MTLWNWHPNPKLIQSIFHVLLWDQKSDSNQKCISFVLLLFIPSIPKIAFRSLCQFLFWGDCSLFVPHIHIYWTHEHTNTEQIKWKTEYIIMTKLFQLFICRLTRFQISISRAIQSLWLFAYYYCLLFAIGSPLCTCHREYELKSKNNNNRKKKNAKNENKNVLKSTNRETHTHMPTESRK